MLSSGARNGAPLGAGLLHEMVQRAGDRIVVMPGAGVNAGNITTLRAATGAREFHASAKRMLPSAMRHTADAALGMSDGESRTDAEEVRRLVAALRSFNRRYRMTIRLISTFSTIKTVCNSRT